MLKYEYTIRGTVDGLIYVAKCDYKNELYHELDATIVSSLDKMNAWIKQCEETDTNILEIIIAEPKDDTI